MKFHSYSEIFPLIEGVEFDALVADIKAHGLREKIWMFEGKILDGRNRFLACQKAKVRPAFRKFSGSDALSFVVSLNIARRHLTVEQRAFAGARIANLQRGDNQHTARAASSQKDVAEKLGVSADSIQRAKKVIEQGSKALQQAAEDGEVPLKKAASVVDLPKAEQLKAATHRAPPEPDDPLRPDDVDEDAEIAAAEQEYMASAEKALGTDALTEIKRLTAELTVVKLARDGFMNGKTAVTKLLKAEQRKSERLEKENEKLKTELESLRERISIMEAA